MRERILDLGRSGGSVDRVTTQEEYDTWQELVRQPGGFVLVQDAKKRPAPEGLPFPAALRTAAGPAGEPSPEQPPEKKE